MQPIQHFTQQQWNALSEQERRDIIHWRLTVARESEAERLKELHASTQFRQERAKRYSERGVDYWMDLVQCYSPGWAFRP